MRVGSHEDRLLFFDWSRSNRGLDVFFKSPVEPTCSECQMLGEKMLRSQFGSAVGVRIRRDTWFEAPFPLEFRFEPDDRPVVHVFAPGAGEPNQPPSVEEIYRGQTEVHCSLTGRQFGCERFTKLTQ